MAATGTRGRTRSAHHTSRSWIRWRLRSLATLELVNIPLQAAVWFDWVPWIGLSLPMTAANAVGFCLFSLLLVQGAVYWFAKLSTVDVPGRRQLPGASAFALTRVVNVPLLAAGVLFTGWAVLDQPGRGSLAGVCFALFAVLEHVNYFHCQLMYDTREDWRQLRRNGPRRAHLARDLDRTRLALRGERR